MTLQEIQYRAQSIIHKWRDDDSAPYVEFVDELAHMNVPEPSTSGSSEVPNDLEEAAEQATIKEGILAGPNFDVAVRTFKAGVKWRDSHFPKLPDDLDKAARKAAVAPFNFDLDEEHLYEYPYLPIAEQKFKEGAKWQAEQDQETIELAEDHAYLAGAVNEREKIMKEAVEGYVTLTLTGVRTVAATIKEEDNIEPGNKVRIIILKEDKNA